MSTNNIFWKTAVYLQSKFQTEFDNLNPTSQNVIDKLIHELEIMVDPEDHKCAIGCPHIPHVYNAIQYHSGNVGLVVALDRIMDKTTFQDNIISLVSCSEIKS